MFVMDNHVVSTTGVYTYDSPEMAQMVFRACREAELDEITNALGFCTDEF